MKTILSLSAVVCICVLVGCAKLGVIRSTGDYEDIASVEKVEAGKEYRLGDSGVCVKVKDDYVLVTYVIPDTPAYGKIQKGDRVRAMQYRGLGGDVESIRKVAAKRIFRLGRDWDWHLYLTVERPSLRDGRGNKLTYDLVMPRPSDNQYHFGPTGFFGKIEPGRVIVDHVAEGSPSDGKLKVGDHIVAVDGRELKGDVFKFFADRVDAAESTSGAGKMELTIFRTADLETDTAQDSTIAARKVEVRLEVLGEYSATSPIDCPKTDKIIKRTADKIIESGKYGRVKTSLLALLATGEKK